MKLSKAIREAMSFLSVDHSDAETESKFSCNCLLLLTNWEDKSYTNKYLDMLQEHGFINTEVKNILLPEHRELSPEKQQFFRIHMMELMACIAEDEGN